MSAKSKSPNPYYRYDRHQEIMTTMNAARSTPWHFGYLAVASLEALGSVGGLLIVNQVGRPVEFHCTSPVLANKTQTILFGKSLANYVYCEQIAGSLLAEVKQRPGILLVNQPDLGDLVHHTSTSVVYVATPQQSAASTSASLSKGSAASGLGEFPAGPSWSEHRLDDLRLGIHAGEMTEDEVMKALAGLIKFIPLSEPFERIAQALEEAHAVAR